MQYLGEILIMAEWWVVLGKFGMSRLRGPSTIAGAVRRNSPGNSCKRKRLQIKIMGSLHGIKGDCPRGDVIGVYANAVEGSESYCSNCGAAHMV